jgi:hypothetical protein
MNATIAFYANRAPQPSQLSNFVYFAQLPTRAFRVEQTLRAKPMIRRMRSMPKIHTRHCTADPSQPTVHKRRFTAAPVADAFAHTSIA